MPAIDLLQYLPAPKRANPAVSARRRALLSHPLVRPDYTTEKLAHLKEISAELTSAGQRNAKVGSLKMDLSIMRTMKRFLDEPAARENLRARVKRSPTQPDLQGVKLLIEHGVETMEQLVVRHPEAAAPTTIPTETATKPDIAIPSEKPAQQVIVHLRELERITQELAARNEKLEQTLRDRDIRDQEREENLARLTEERDVSQRIATELGEKFESFKKLFQDAFGGIPAAIAKRLEPNPTTPADNPTTAKQKRPTIKLPTGNDQFGVPLHYTREFLEEYGRRSRREQKALVKALGQLHPTQPPGSLRTIKPPQSFPGLPQGGLVSHAGNWRFGWKKEGGRIMVYILAHRGDRRFYASER
ncbi:MAG TPA: hypothetical protein VJZ94_01675 [Candidatus Paceibacterota bacterium]|nr:hypothetical protein [Candidatus Paceibacterota bacterium]